MVLLQRRIEVLSFILFEVLNPFPEATKTFSKSTVSYHSTENELTYHRCVVHLSNSTNEDLYLMRICSYKPNDAGFEPQILSHVLDFSECFPSWKLPISTNRIRALHEALESSTNREVLQLRKFKKWFEDTLSADKNYNFGKRDFKYKLTRKPNVTHLKSVRTYPKESDPRDDTTAYFYDGCVNYATPVIINYINGEDTYSAHENIELFGDEDLEMSLLKLKRLKLRNEFFPLSEKYPIPKPVIEVAPPLMLDPAASQPSVVDLDDSDSVKIKNRLENLDQLDQSQKEYEISSRLALLQAGYSETTANCDSKKVGFAIQEEQMKYKAPGNPFKAVEKGIFDCGTYLSLVN